MKRAFLIIGVVFFVGYLLFNSDGPAKPKNPDNLLAYLYAEKFVKQSLKAPRTAKFPTITEKDKHSIYLGGGEYQIDSWVDSENSFGALLRQYFSCKIIIDENTVTYKDLKFQ